MKKKVFVLAAVFSGLFIGCTGGDPTEPLNGSDSSVLVDGRDGNVYRTVNMAGLKWMAENLRYYNMDKVLGCSLDPSSEESRIPKCYLEDCKSYGYFYANLKNVCPEGWRLPTRDDYARLLAETSVGGYQELFASTGWNAPVSLDGDTILFATSSVMDLFVNGEEKALLFGLSRTRFLRKKFRNICWQRRNTLTTLNYSGSLGLMIGEIGSIQRFSLATGKKTGSAKSMSAGSHVVFAAAKKCLISGTDRS